MSLLLPLVLLWGCEDSAGPTVGELDDALVQQLIEELVIESMQAIGRATLITDPSGPVLGFGLPLPGVDFGIHGSGTSFPGNPVGTGDPFCQHQFHSPGDPFWEGLDICQRLTKHSETSYSVEVYYTVQPITEPDEPHAFSYTTEEPAGTVNYDPNPLIRWDHDFSDPGLSVVTAAVDLSLTFEAPDGGMVDLSHTAAFEGHHHDNEGVILSVNLEIAANQLCDEAIAAWVVDEGDIVEGSIMCGSTELAAVSHGPEDFSVEWHSFDG